MLLLATEMFFLGLVFTTTDAYLIAPELWRKRRKNSHLLHGFRSERSSLLDRQQEQSGAQLRDLRPGMLP